MTGIARARPALLILAGRNLVKVQQTADAISATGVKVGFDSIVPCTPEVSAITYAYAAFDPEVTGKCLVHTAVKSIWLIMKAHNGAYLLSCRLADPLSDVLRPWATSSVEAERLWRLSEKLVGQEFPY